MNDELRTIADLRAAHGTPEEFKRAVWGAVGEISIDEAMAAIEKYQREWDEAAYREIKRHAR